MTYRILVTGSRHWKDWAVIEAALAEAVGRYHSVDNQLVLVHGGCPTGADAMADNIWRSWIPKMLWPWLLEPEVHHPDWNRYGKAAGPIRNTQMVNLGAAVCLAFPHSKSMGTRDCMDKAKAAGIPVVVHKGGG